MPRHWTGASLMADNKVQLEIFEGPLDLLLYLVKKEEVDIYEVNLTKIATQFIEYVELMKELDLDIAGEFLVMAATLMYIKSRELLPKNQQVEVPDEEEEEDPRWELIRQLVEYKKFKDAAAKLHERELLQEQIYARIPGRPDFAADQPLALAVEELQSQLCLKRFDLMADRALRDTQLFGGACEAFVPGRSLEGLERIQGRQAARHEHTTS